MIDLFDEQRGSDLPGDEPRLLDRDDVSVLLRTPGVRADVRASARLFGTLAGTATRRDVAVSRRRLGAPEHVPTVDPAVPIGVGGRLLEPSGLAGHFVGTRRRRIVRK